MSLANSGLFLLNAVAVGDVGEVGEVGSDHPLEVLFAEDRDFLALPPALLGLPGLVGAPGAEASLFARPFGLLGFSSPGTVFAWSGPILASPNPPLEFKGEAGAEVRLLPPVEFNGDDGSEVLKVLFAGSLSWLALLSCMLGLRLG